MRPGPDDPLFREPLLWRLAGGPLVAVTVLSGVVCGVLAVVIDPGLLGRSQAWLAIPAAIPVAFALASGRSVLAGALAGLFAALGAFLILGAYLLWEAVCFVITFMGDC